MSLTWILASTNNYNRYGVIADLICSNGITVNSNLKFRVSDIPWYL